MVMLQSSSSTQPRASPSSLATVVGAKRDNRDNQGRTSDDALSRKEERSPFSIRTQDVEKLELTTMDNSTLHEFESESPSRVSPGLKEKFEQTILVQWCGPQDPDNPRNWSKKQRWTVTWVVSLFTFISPVASSISSPALPQISSDLNIPPGSILENMSLSIFVLAYALGPLIWGPLSELCGRLIILQISNIWFLAKTPAQMLVFRFLAGFGGAAPQSIGKYLTSYPSSPSNNLRIISLTGGGVIGDLWSPEERGMAMSLYSLAPLVGPSTGPLVGGWIALKSKWQWVFWSVSIADGLLQIAGFVFLRETYGPHILRKKALSLRTSTGKNYRSAFEDPGQHWSTYMARGMFKPIKFLFTEPIVQVFALYMAVLYGVLYLSLTAFVDVLTNQYGENLGVAGIHYLAIALGSTVGGQVGARVLNTIYRRLKARNGGVGTPEMRLPLLMASAATLPIGLLIYGWTANARLFWLIPDLGVFIYSIGIGGNWTCIQTYLVDNYALHAASAIAGVVSFRAFAGFGFPLFADQMYGKLGDGWGNSILALICFVIGCPAPFIFYRYGPKLRSWSKATSVEQ
ncbi:hypothetical protein D9757_002566 [Collybiopsis confluens]|uniref:Major facilitator superfamily (MFS) profile domain-containing protein n=1 Tax=Collybiopsis confluens TaxID=2823264 RepID=A0A8H5HW59_9AGAR|nr:hypothetical protein D9757_002566 [Collybiopsis confluens]